MSVNPELPLTRETPASLRHWIQQLDNIIHVSLLSSPLIPTVDDIRVQDDMVADN